MAHASAATATATSEFGELRIEVHVWRQILPGNALTGSGFGASDSLMVITRAHGDHKNQKHPSLHYGAFFFLVLST